MWITSLFFAGCFSLALTCKCSHRESPRDVTDDKVWLFSVDGRRRPYNFLDQNGKLVGFDIDFISKVCAVAEKKCKIVTADFTECTITDRNINYPGRGLMSEWFDACPGYVISPDRQGAFDFTKPYLQTDASFTVKPGNPSKFNPESDDYSKFTLAHLTGAVTNAQCLTRLNKKFGKIIYASSLPDAKKKILDGEADVLFSARHQIPDLEVLPARVHCELGGTAVLLKKGSPMAEWWNPAFDKVMASGDLDKICKESNKKYNGTIRCLTKDSKADAPEVSKTEAGEKVWLFATSGRRAPFTFLDDGGKLTGFNVELVRGVCAEAKQNCRSVLSQYTECGFTERNINYPGRGLMDGWFDACPGYGDSVDRGNGVEFTDAFLQTYAAFAVMPGNPAKFNPKSDDFSGFNITHLTGAVTNAACLNRLKKKNANIIISPNLPAAKKLLQEGGAQVIFSVRGTIPDLDVLPERFHCEKSGSTVMVKKGSPLVEWWNKAFRSYVKKGLYSKLCQESRKKYNWPIRCFPESS